VVVGVSLAGLRGIEALRREGHVGEVVAVGAELHLPYDRPPLSKQFLKGSWSEEKLSLRRQGYDDLAVDWRLGRRAVRLDGAGRRLHLDDGSHVDYDGLLISTGSRARQLPFARGLAGVHVLRSLDDARALRDGLQHARRVAVVGAGFIGMEVAATCCELGREVSVIEPLPTPLVRGLGPELGELVAARHREAGVALRCGVAVSGFEGERRVEAVRLGDGSRVESDVVVVGIGATPETGWLEGSGLVLDDGIVCDAKGATALPDVVAAGDVARWANPLFAPLDGARPPRFEHWTSAVEQSERAAQRLLRGDAGSQDFAEVPYVWSDQHDLRIAIVGDTTGADAMEIRHGSLEGGRFLALFGRDGRLIGAVGFRRPAPLLACRDLLAAGASWDEALKANS
jgi:NADPH-dependent 2,4-dienoyl-CoA reductase/sulfur reductase-like enzyme